MVVSNGKMSGVSVKCESACIKNEMRFEDFEDDIVGKDPYDKAMYWLERTLEEVKSLDENAFGMVRAWLKSDDSMMLTVYFAGCGKIDFKKLYRW